LSDAFDHYVIELGARDNLGPDRVKEGTKAIAAIMEVPRQSTFDLCVGGYGDDPREVYDIPEVMAFFTAVLTPIAGMYGKSALLTRTGFDSKPLVALAVGIINRDQIRITGKDRP
jgi:hypothetical protein